MVLKIRCGLLARSTWELVRNAVLCQSHQRTTESENGVGACSNTNLVPTGLEICVSTSTPGDFDALFDVTKLKLGLALTTCCIDCEFNRCYYFIIIKGVALESQGVNVPGYFDDCWIMWKYNGLLFKKKNRSINIIHGSIRLEAIYFPYQKKNHYPSVRDRNHICTFQSQTIQTSRTKPTISCLCRLGQFTLCISVTHL